tara:strand:+ start:352 stop:516 length:165 start_codon:yes stop_codon:yes gene_type:complete
MTLSAARDLCQSQRWAALKVAAIQSVPVVFIKQLKLCSNFVALPAKLRYLAHAL